MKYIKKICALLIVLSILMSIFAVSAFAASTKYVYTVGKVHVRKGPGLEYSSICSLPADTCLKLVKTTYDDRNIRWAKVQHGKHYGWISFMFLSTKEGGSSAIGSLKLTGSEHIRYSPSINAKSIGTVSRGTKLSYYDTAKDLRGVTWYLINHKGKIGWISSKSTGGSAKGSYIVADDGNTHVRKGPGLDYKVIGTLKKGKKVDYKGSTKYDDRGIAWYQVSWNGKSGWVSSMFTKKLPK